MGAARRDSDRQEDVIEDLNRLLSVVVRHVEGAHRSNATTDPSRTEGPNLADAERRICQAQRFLASREIGAARYEIKHLMHHFGITEFLIPPSETS